MRRRVEARAAHHRRRLAADDTVGHTPMVTGALNGSGGEGCGTPVAGLGMMWIGIPMI